MPTLTWVHGNHTYQGGRGSLVPGANHRSSDRRRPELRGSHRTGDADRRFGDQSGRNRLSRLAGSTGRVYRPASLTRISCWAMSPPPRNMRRSMPACSNSSGALFVQDSWKVTRKLTVDYGLRWDYATAAQEEHGRSANLGLTTPNPAAGGRPGAAIFEATCNCTFVKNYPYAIGPRLGIAYALDAKTVFRGGWGFAYGFRPTSICRTRRSSTNTPTGVNAFATLNDAWHHSAARLAQFHPGQTPLPGATTSGFLAYLDPGAARPPRQNQWSIGIQREITPNTVIEAAYVANRGVWWSLDRRARSTAILNQVSPAAFAAVGLSPYTNAGGQSAAGLHHRQRRRSSRAWEPSRPIRATPPATL